MIISEGMLIVLGELSSTQLICKYNKIKIVNIEYHTKASRLVFGIEYLRKESQEQLMEISESQLKNLLKHTFLYASDKAYNHFPPSDICFSKVFNQQGKDFERFYELLLQDPTLKK